MHDQTGIGAQRQFNYDKGERIVELLKEMERFADYYARITRGTEPDADLARAAGQHWRYLDISANDAWKYAPQEKRGKSMNSVTFRNVFEASLVEPGTVLVPKSDEYTVAAKVTETGLIELPNGETFKSPSPAAIRAVLLAGGHGIARNGWHFWTVGTDGPLLDELRAQYLLSKGHSVTSNIRSLRIAFWDGFYEYCSSNEAFISCFNDPGNRASNPDNWGNFGIGTSGMHLAARLNGSDNSYGVELLADTPEEYEKVLAFKDKFNEKWQAETGLAAEWDSRDEDKKTRHVIVKAQTDYDNDDNDDWNDIYQWLIDWLFRFRELALAAGG